MLNPLYDYISPEGAARVDKLTAECLPKVREIAEIIERETRDVVGDPNVDTLRCVLAQGVQMLEQGKFLGELLGIASEQ